MPAKTLTTFVLLLSGSALMAETPPELVEAIKFAKERNTFAAFGKLEKGREPAAVAKLYSQSVFVLYGEHDVPRMIAFGRRGIAYALDHADREGIGEKEADELRSWAKTMAFNVGANCWPGWKDPGIVITKTDLALGLDAARLNLRLAQELRKGEEKVGGAHWLLGAQQMANGDPETARKTFLVAAGQYELAKKPVEKQMTLGYAALAGLMIPATREARTAEFAAALEALRSEGSDDAKFYVGQLETARGVFVDEAANESKDGDSDD